MVIGCYLGKDLGQVSIGTLNSPVGLRMVTCGKALADPVLGELSLVVLATSLESPSVISSLASPNLLKIIS